MVAKKTDHNHTPWDETMDRHILSQNFENPMNSPIGNKNVDANWQDYDDRFCDAQLGGWHRVNPTMIDEEDPPPSSKLTGSNYLIIWINENPNGDHYNRRKKRRVKNKTLDLQEMHDESGDFDFISVNNIDDTQEILESHYGKGNVPDIDDLVLRSHGNASDSKNIHGPDFNSASGVGITHNPTSSSGLKYLKSILSNDADIVFTACNSVMNYGLSIKFSASSRSLASNYSNFFLEGTNRSLYMNWAKSSSRRNVSSTTEIFNFDRNMRKDSYGGFIRFYYNNEGVWSKDINFYNITIDSGWWFGTGGIETSIFMPIPTNK